MAHSVFLGRIRQIGSDAVTNYSIESTSAYDSLNPAATRTALPGNENLFYDQDLIVTVPPGSQFAHEGLVFTFDRQCYRFWGVVPKINFTFDEDPLNTSALEFWTHQSQDDTWTLRNRILLNDPFRGTRSGRAKFFDFRLESSLLGIDQVWVTTAPAFGFTVDTEFIAVHLFGACHDRIETPGDCHDDPNIDCIDPGPCETDESCLVPPLDCTNFAPSVCDLPPFDWPKIPPDAGGPTPPSEPPNLPLVDLCDPVALKAFEDSMTPDQLAYFTNLLAQTELPCLVDGKPQKKLPINDDGTGKPLLKRQPVEAYMDPKTGVPGPDPANPDPPADDPTKYDTYRAPVFLFPSPNQKLGFQNHYLTTSAADIQAAWVHPAVRHDQWNATDTARAKALKQIILRINANPGTIVNIRVISAFISKHFGDTTGAIQPVSPGFGDTGITPAAVDSSPAFSKFSFTLIDNTFGGAQLPPGSANTIPGYAAYRMESGGDVLSLGCFRESLWTAVPTSGVNPTYTASIRDQYHLLGFFGFASPPNVGAAPWTAEVGQVNQYAYFIDLQFKVPRLGFNPTPPTVDTELVTAVVNTVSGTISEIQATQTDIPVVVEVFPDDGSGGSFPGTYPWSS